MLVGVALGNVLIVRPVGSLLSMFFLSVQHMILRDNICTLMKEPLTQEAIDFVVFSRKLCYVWANNKVC